MTIRTGGGAGGAGARRRGRRRRCLRRVRRHRLARWPQALVGDRVRRRPRRGRRPGCRRGVAPVDRPPRWRGAPAAPAGGASGWCRRAHGRLGACRRGGRRPAAAASFRRGGVSVRGPHATASRASIRTGKASPTGTRLMSCRPPSAVAVDATPTQSACRRVPPDRRLIAGRPAVAVRSCPRLHIAAPRGRVPESFTPP